eukprot:TRINITY_DN92022_c0_g1_i1.p1 TRINITY_DN92022_c0_g1~~TRINITY_DN92022_c0_g1_i1.p1  ORF type:complete len:305 (+),score=34.00 TRINITY_DN92022_c0_g1_i1:32-916(+)
MGAGIMAHAARVFMPSTLLQEIVEERYCPINVHLQLASLLYPKNCVRHRTSVMDEQIREPSLRSLHVHCLQEITSWFSLAELLAVRAADWGAMQWAMHPSTALTTRQMHHLIRIGKSIQMFPQGSFDLWTKSPVERARATVERAMSVSEAARQLSEAAVQRSEAAVQRSEAAIQRYEMGTRQCEAAIERYEVATRRCEATIQRYQAAIQLCEAKLARLRWAETKAQTRKRAFESESTTAAVATTQISEAVAQPSEDTSLVLRGSTEWGAGACSGDGQPAALCGLRLLRAALQHD